MLGIWKIKYYTPPSGGESPIYEFIESLPEKAQSKLVNSLDLLSAYGIQLKEPHVKKVAGTPLWEFRILGENSIRVFYIALKGSTFLLLHAFKKKKQKTPHKEIQTALNRLEEFQSR